MDREEINVTRASLPDIMEYYDEIRDIWDSHWLTNMGPKHQKLQNELKRFLSVTNIELLTNGHMALELTLQALRLNDVRHIQNNSELGKGRKEIITTPFTFASTTHAIVRNGMTPVFCDINPDDFTIDVSKIESLITDDTVAIMPVHVYGNICDVYEIKKVADKYGLKVIYDAAHAFCESINGVNVANFGDASCFSFHATKVFNTIEGGAVCFKDEDFGLELYRLKNFGIRSEEVVDGVGANAKMNEFCAAMGLCNLKHVKNEINKRKTITRKYDELLDNVPGVVARKIQKGVVSNYAYYPILIDEEKYGENRDRLYDRLRKHGIHARKYFYPLTNSFDCFKGYFDSSETPIAKRISEQVLTLPLYPDLKMPDVIEICKLIHKSGAN